MGEVTPPRPLRADGVIVDYVSLSAAQIERAFLPKAQQRNKPDPSPSPCSVSSPSPPPTRATPNPCLPSPCAARWRAAAHVGSYAVITHPLDDRVRAFYACFHFQEPAGRSQTRDVGAHAELVAADLAS